MKELVLGNILANPMYCTVQIDVKYTLTKLSFCQTLKKNLCLRSGLDALDTIKTENINV